MDFDKVFVMEETKYFAISKKMYRVNKRIFDIGCSLFLLICLLPILLIVAVLIKIDSKGPAIFKQVRSGKGDKPFTLYKFRSCAVDNDINDKTKGDNITKVGKILRKTSLDELPQLINIIKGEMSFIGPRPWILDYSENFTKEQKRRLEVRPGITGLAQCSGRNILDINDKIKCDLEYVDNLSIKMDIKIIFMTIKSVFTSEGVSAENKLTVHNELYTLRENKLREEIDIVLEKEKTKVYNVKEEKNKIGV